MILEAKNLEIGYPSSPLLKGLEFQIKAGELICLMGPNGCGKTTLLRTLTGLTPLMQGSVEVLGKPLADYDEPELAKQLSLVLTDKPVLENLRVEEVVGLGRYPHLGFWGKLTSNDLKVINESLELLKIQELRNDYFQELSDGQKQKVFIARALAQDTPLILLDEPTTFLDISHRMEILRLLQEITEVKKKALLFTSHDWELVLEMKGEVWLIDRQERLHRGIVEDLVLNGIFEETFKADGFNFDYKKGTFRESRPYQQEISIIGDDEKLIEWTKRALEKRGIRQVSSSSAPQLEIREGSWVFQNQSFKNLTLLIASFKSQLV